MNHRFRSSLLTGLACALAAAPVFAKDALPAAPPVAAKTSLPPDPGNVLNRSASGLPTPPTLPDGVVVGIGYWSYVMKNAMPPMYCVEPKVFSCGKAQQPQTWSAQPTLELIDGSGTPIKSMVLPQPLTTTKINSSGIAPAVGSVPSPGSLAQWCVQVSGLGTGSFPNWKLRLGGKTQPIEWNPKPLGVKTVAAGPSPC